MKKHSLLLLSILTVASLAACSDGGNSSASEGPTEIITEADLSTGVTTYTNAAGTTLNLTRSGIYEASGYPHVNSHPDSGKKQKLLVAPISFKKDTTTDENYIEPTDDLLNKIDKTFTATDEEMLQLSGSALNSVQSFYNQSSFGKGAFDVVVLPTWVEYNGTASDFQTMANGQAGVSMSKYVKEWYAKEYAQPNHGSLGADWQYKWSDFDTDNDGYIDLIWQVYAYKYTQSSTSFWWAYVTYTGNSANKADPNIMTLAWASTQFMTENFNGYDPHTFIHETGHTLGVNDFYDYNSSWKPIGSIDYMDQNLGDHSAYTKFSFGWINPYVLKEEDLAGGKTAEITLRAGTTSGDALVLASPDYNGTAFDEYLMVELMGPYGLAKRDYESGYSNTSGYTEPGIRITHVDARMSKSADHDTIITDPNELGKTGGSMHTCNTYGGRSGVKVDSDFWPAEDTSKSVPNSVKKNHPNAKVGTVAKMGDSSKNAYFTEISLLESSVQSTNWTSTANYNASTSTTLFKRNQRFNLWNSTKGEASTWATHFMPSSSNLWNKAKTTLGWASANSETMYYEIDESKTCNFNVRVKDIVEDDEYGAKATLTITLLDSSSSTSSSAA